MRTGALYGVFMSVGILLGAFNTNVFWMITVPTFLTFLAMITVVHGEKARERELQDARKRVGKVLQQQRAYARDRFDVL
jgi:hypothetical protein